MSALEIFTLRLILSDPHTSYQASVIRALEYIAQIELNDVTAPDLDYIGDPLPGYDDMADLVGAEQC